MSLRRGAPVLLALLCSIGCATEESSETSTGEVIAGRAESGYPAAGYLLDGSDFICTAALIAPRVALTAAHCTAGLGGRSYFGVGQLSEGLRVRVQTIVRDPQDSAANAQHDMALLVLQSAIPGIRPAEIGAPGSGCGYRYVGYGTTETGDAGVRKSAAQCMDPGGWGTIFKTHGVGGGLCFGDSGGPLFVEGENRVVGVLSGFAGSTGNCVSGNQMVFNDPSKIRSLIESVTAGNTGPGVPSPVVSAPICGGATCSDGDMCCIALWGTSCASGCGFGTQMHVACDGPEDCGSGRTCCTSDPGGGSDVDCVASCSGRTAVCHRDADCGSGLSCCKAGHGLRTCRRSCG